MERINDIVGLIDGSTPIYRTAEAAMRWCGYSSIADVQTYVENGVVVGYY